MIVERIKWHRIAEDIDEAKARTGDKGLMRIYVKNDPYCIVHMDGKIVVIGDKCPHQGASLSAGWCEHGKVVCPVHRYRFDPLTGKGFDGEGERVACYPVEQREQGLCMGVPYTTVRILGFDLW